MKFHRRKILSLLPITFASGALQSNPFESPSILSDTTDVCSAAQGRTSKCEVQLDVPASCVSADGTSSCPIVFFFHGAGGTNAAFKRNSEVHENDAIGVYPTGEDGWNTGPKNSNSCPWDDFECSEDPDEGGFIAGIITKLRNMGAMGNIYAIGSSNGGALVNRLGSNAGDDMPIRGIVSLVTQLLSSPPRSGPGTLNYNQPSSNGPPVSVLNIMGTSDGVIPYEGGSSPVFGGDTNFELYSAIDSMGIWSDHNGCGSPISRDVSTSDGDGSGTFYEYPNCSNGAIVEHYAIHGGGHNAGGSSIDGREARDVQYDFIRRCEGTPITPTAPTPTSPIAPPPVTAPVPTPTCVDDSDWRGKFNIAHDCGYVAASPDRRCTFESADGIRASTACALSCGTCDENPAPTSTPPPVPVPTSTPPPVPAPTSTPPPVVADDDDDFDDSCEDDDSWHGKFSENHNCDWVSQNSETRCNFENSEGVLAIDGCPIACDTCPDDDDDDDEEDDDDDDDSTPDCLDDATWRGKKNEAHDCDFVGQKPGNRCSWENADGVEAIDACLVSCGSC